MYRPTGRSQQFSFFNPIRYEQPRAKFSWLELVKAVQSERLLIARQPQVEMIAAGCRAGTRSGGASGARCADARSFIGLLNSDCRADPRWVLNESFSNHRWGREPGLDVTVSSNVADGRWVPAAGLVRARSPARDCPTP